MKKRIVVLILVFVVLACAAFFIFFARQTFHQQITVPYSMFKASEQFTNPANVVKWYIPFVQSDQRNTDTVSNHRIIAGNYSLEIVDQTMVSAILKTGAGNRQKEFLFTTIPDSNKSTESKITLTYKNTFFNEWLGKDELVKNAKQSLVNLKEYMEDTKRLYGYEIRAVTVADTSFLFLSETVPVAEKRMATRQLFERLIAYAEQKNAGYNGVRIFYFQKSGDQVTLFASIGISNKIDIPSSEPFQYKVMPFGKNLLEATYQGPYGEAGKVFEALEAFKADHNLVSMAIPFQKFVSDGYDFGDEQVVQLKVYYPIF